MLTKKIKWIYEKNGIYVYRRPFGKKNPRQLLILGKPIYNN